VPLPQKIEEGAMASVTDDEYEDDGAEPGKLSFW